MVLSRSSALLIAFLLGLASPSAADDRRFIALFSSGEIVHGRDLRSWHGPSGRPALDERPLFEAANPVRWIIDSTLSPAQLPPAFVELHGGDRIPGRVVSYRRGNESPYEQQLPYVLVEPTEPLNGPEGGPEGPRRSTLRVSVRWARRVVWERRGSDVYRPGTLYFRDRRAQRFRSLRWGETAVRLLLADVDAAGTLEVPFADIAELHLPAIDSWDAACEQLAMLDPEGRAGLFQLETEGGLRVTGSLERFLARSNGGENDPKSWLHGVAPAWSPDAVWVRHRQIRVRRYFQPGELPLTLLEPVSTDDRHVFGSSWSWQRDRGTQGEPLRAGGLERGFGIGVHAPARLEIELPAIAASFRSLVAIDDSSGGGGCARALLAIGSADVASGAPCKDQPLFKSPLLIGSRKIVDTGWHDLVRVPGARSGTQNLVLFADSADSETPLGADPFDIRDAVDWIEPTLRIDRRDLQAECRLRMARLVPAWQGWNVDCPDAAPAILINRMAENGSRWWMDAAPALPFLRLTRRLTLREGARWLCLSVLRNIDREKRSQISVSANGKLIATQDVPMRFDWSQTEPILVPIEGLEGTDADIEILVSGSEPRASVEWAGIGVIDLPPGLACLHAGAEEPGEVSAARLAGLGYPIRERPRFGEYRYIKFEWRALEADEVSLEIGHDGRWGPELERKGRGFRYVASPQEPAKGEGRRVADSPPVATQSVVRDLHDDFGAFTLSGLELKARRGRIFFQNIYLARTQKDFERLKGDQR